MNVDNRNIAAEVCALGSENEEIAYDAFCDGTDWLMKEPLSERLTEAEKEKIRAFYNGDTFGELDFIEIASTRRVLKSIFGKTLFTKTECNEKQ